ncbi:MAG: PEP-CTERM sorting domain-containing protein [Planctomycetia bacterium]|jgi:hypothetical protein
MSKKITLQCIAVLVVTFAYLALGSATLAVEVPERKVLWDISHGADLDYTLTGDYLPLVQNLADNGFSVDSTDQGFLVDDPSDYDVIVVANNGSMDSYYTSAEVAAITDFVHQGGGLLILGNTPWQGAPNPGNQHIQPVASVFGVTLGASDVSPDSLYFSDFAEHPIFDGISELFMQAAGELEIVSPASEIAWQNNTDVALIATANYGDGRVIALGDADIFLNISAFIIYDRVDNRPFSINTFEYLAGPVAVPEPSSIVLLVMLGMSLALGVRAKRRRATKA